MLPHQLSTLTEDAKERKQREESACLARFRSDLEPLIEKRIISRTRKAAEEGGSSIRLYHCPRTWCAPCIFCECVPCSLCECHLCFPSLLEHEDYIESKYGLNRHSAMEEASKVIENINTTHQHGLHVSHTAVKW